MSETGLFEESMAIIGKSGNPEDIVWIDMVSCRKDFLDFYRLELIDSEQTARLLPATAYPVVVNETFVKKFVPDGINPIGEQVSKYLPDEPLFDNRTIVGVVRDFRKRIGLAVVYQPERCIVCRCANTFGKGRGGQESGSLETVETEMGRGLSRPDVCIGYPVFVCGNQFVADFFWFVQFGALYRPSAST